MSNTKAAIDEVLKDKQDLAEKLNKLVDEFEEKHFPIKIGVSDSRPFSVLDDSPKPKVRIYLSFN